MAALNHYFYPWGFVLQGIAIIHFIRRRPDTYWMYIILFVGPIGAAVYLFAEVIPDLGLLSHSFKKFPRRKRIKELESIVKDNPSAGNFEELGDLYMDEGKLPQARAALDRAIAARADTPDPFYRRGICALELGDPAAAIPDFERIVEKDPAYDFHRATGLLAQCFARTGDTQKAKALFEWVTVRSTLSETYLNYANFLISQGQTAEARVWAQKVLDKKPTMPRYLRRRERPWFRGANKVLKQLPA